MKKRLNKKLFLNKSTVVSLESKEMKHANGGKGSFYYTCITACLFCTDPEYCDMTATRTCTC